jgi:O-antigen/teichoic acid export membrane protein
LFAAYLTPSEYGILALATIVTQILRPTLSLGMQAAALKFYYSFQSDEERRAFYGDLWLFYLFGSGSLFVVMDLVGSPVWTAVFTQVPYAPHLRIAVWTAFLSAALLDIPRQIFRASGRPVPYGVLNVGNFLLTAGFAVWFVALNGEQALGAVKAILFGTAATGAGCAVYLIRYVRFRGNRIWIRKAVGYSIPLVPHFVAHWVLNAGDRVVLEWFVPLSEVGVYTVGYTVGWSVTLVQAALTNALIPLYGDLDVADDASITRLAGLVTYYAAALGVFGMGVILFAPELFAVLASDTYAGAAAIVPWAVVGAIFLGLYTPSVQILTLTLGRTRLVGLATVFAATLNFALNLLLVPRIGMLGAAFTTSVTYLALAAGTLYAAQRQVRIAYEYTRIGVILAATILPAVAINLILPDVSVLAFLVKLLLFFAPLLILWWAGLIPRNARAVERK